MMDFDTRAHEPKTVVLLDPTSADGEAPIELLGQDDRHVCLVTFLGHVSSSAIRRFADAEEVGVFEAADRYLDQVADRVSAGCDRLVETIVSAGSEPQREIRDLIVFDSVAKVLVPRSLTRSDEQNFRREIDAPGVRVEFAGRTLAGEPQSLISPRRGRRRSGRALDLPMLAHVPAEELIALDVLTTCVDLRADARVIRQSTKGEQCLIVVDGVLNVERDGALVAELGPGQCVGELALLTGAPCNADVTAATDATVLVMSAREFTTMLDECPTIASHVLRGAVSRLAAA